MRKAPLHEHLTRSESEVLTEALNLYIRAQDRRAAHGEATVRDDAAWKQYLALELRNEATQP